MSRGLIMCMAKGGKGVFKAVSQPYFLIFSQCYWYWLSSSTNDRGPRVAVTEELVVDGSASLTEAELVRTMRRRRKKPLMSMVMLGGVATAEEELSVVIQCLKVRGGLQRIVCKILCWREKVIEGKYINHFHHLSIFLLWVRVSGPNLFKGNCPKSPFFQCEPTLSPNIVFYLCNWILQEGWVLFVE